MHNWKKESKNLRMTVDNTVPLRTKTPFCREVHTEVACKDPDLERGNITDWVYVKLFCEVSGIFKNVLYINLF